MKERARRRSAPTRRRPKSTELSHELRALFVSIDRRLFPHERPLEPRLPSGDETPQQLVPDELLETMYVAAEELDDDPIAATTLSDDTVARSRPTGEHATPLAVPLPERRSRPAPSVETPSAASPTLAEIDIGELTNSARSRRGTFDDARAGIILWRLVEQQVDVRAEFRPEGGPKGALSLRGGVAVRLDIDITPSAPAATLERLRAERLAREGFLRTIVSARSGSFELVSLEGTNVTPLASVDPPFRHGIRPALVEAARTGLDRARVTELLGAARLYVHVAPEFTLPRWVAETGLEPEIFGWLMRSEASTVDDLLEGVPASLGLPGIVYFLGAVGLLRLMPA